MTVSNKKSTIGRTFNSATLAALRAAFRTLERVAPGLGARWGVRMWFTAPRRAPRAGSCPAPGGSPIEVAVHGRSVVGTRWGDGPLVYLVHGWGGCRDQMDGFVEPLRRAGYGVVAFDALGHGESAPGREGHRRTTLVEFADALTVVASEHGRPYGIIAHSAGAVACTLAIGDGVSVDRLVFVAPMPDGTVFLRRHPLRFGPRISALMAERAELLLRAPLSDFDLTTKACTLGDRLPPLLVVHDQQDREIDVEDGAGLARQWPEGKFHGTRGLGHRRILRDPEVLATAVNWLDAGRPVHKDPAESF